MKKLSILLSIFLLGINTFSLAQDQNVVDSLRQIVQNKNTPDTTQLEALFELSNLYQRTDFDKSLEYGTQLLELSKKVNNKKKEAEAYNLIGWGYGNLNKSLDTILIALQKALDISLEIKDTALIITNYNAIARAYHTDAVYEKAFINYQAGLILSEATNNTRSIVITLNNLGLILRQEEDYEKAKKYFARALDYAEKLPNNKRFLAALNNNMGSTYDKQDSLDQALPYYEIALAIKKELNDRYGMVSTLLNIGVLKANKKQYELAYQTLEEGYEIAKSLNYVDGLGLILSGLGDLHYKQKKYSQATQYFEEAIVVLGENGNLYTKMTCYELLSDTYEAVGDYKAAFYNNKQFHIIQDSIFRKESANKITELETKYQVQQKETENKLLKSEQDAAKKNARNTSIIAIGLLLGLILSIGWGYAIYQANQQKKRLNTQLEQKVQERTQELHSANKELQQVNYELKTFNYIASHDIKEPIRNIGSFVGLIQRRIPESVKNSLDFYFSTIKRSTSQLYTLVEDFSKYTTLSKEEIVDLMEVDLNETTQNLTDNFQETLKEKNAKIINHGLPIIKTSPSMIYIALKHLVDNGLKYNKAEKPKVEISYQSIDDQHQIIVSDNGIGIDHQFHPQIFDMFKRLHDRATYKGSGIGLAIVKLMVEKLNGTIKLESQIGAGSQFIIKLPKS